MVILGVTIQDAKSEENSCLFNPRRAGGCLNTPFRFFADSWKSRFWHSCLYIFSAHFVKSSDPVHSRSGHQVTSSDLTSEKLWMFVIATPNDRLPWNFQLLISVPVSMKRISRNFDTRDLRSGQFCNLSIISQWEKNERRLFCTKTIQNTLKHRVKGIIDTLSRNIVTGDPSSCRQGHFTSYKFHSSFSAIPFDRDQLEQWKHHRSVQDDHTDRLICIMTFFDQFMTLTLGQIFKMTLKSNYILFDASWQEKHDAGNINIVALLSQKLLQKNDFRKNCYFFSFCSLEAKPLILDQIWGHVSERALKELSNALLRSTVALLIPELCASLLKNVEIGQIWPLVTSGDLTFDLT